MISSNIGGDAMPAGVHKTQRQCLTPSRNLRGTRTQLAGMSPRTAWQIAYPTEIPPHDIASSPFIFRPQSLIGERETRSITSAVTTPPFWERCLVVGPPDASAAAVETRYLTAIKWRQPSDPFCAPRRISAISAAQEAKCLKLFSYMP